MALEITTTLKQPQRSPRSDVWQRRDYPKMQEIDRFEVGTDRRPVSTDIKDIQFIYARVVGDESPVKVFKNIDPSHFTFTDTLLMFGVQGVSRLAFQAVEPTTLYLFIAGE